MYKNFAYYKNVYKLFAFLYILILSSCTVNHYHYMANYTCDNKQEFKAHIDTTINNKVKQIIRQQY